MTDNLHAQTSWKGIIDSNWRNVSNWTSGVPTSTIDAIIGDANFTGIFQPVLTGNAACKSLSIGAGSINSTLTLAKNITISGNLTIGSNGTLFHNINGFKITIKGNWINSGNYIIAGVANSVTFSGSSQTITGATIFNSITINTGSTVTLATDISIITSLIISGTLDPTGLYKVSGSGLLTINGGGLLYIKTSTFAGNCTLSGAISLSGTSIINYASTSISQDINSALIYGYLRISGGSTKYLVSDLPNLNSSSANSGRIYVDAGIFDLQTYSANRGTTVNGGFFIIAANTTLRIGGTSSFPSNYSTITPALTSNVEYYGNNQTILNVSYGDLTFKSTTGIAVKTLPSTSMTIAGRLTTEIGTGSGVLFTAGNVIIVNRTVTLGANTTFDGGSFIHIFKSNWTNNGTYTGNTSTATFQGLSAVLSGNGTNNFYHIKFTSANITSAANTNFNISGNVTTSGSGDFTQASGGVFLMSGTAKTITGNGLKPCNLSITGSISTSGNINVSGDFIVDGSFAASNPSIITLSGINKTISGSGIITFYQLNITGIVITSTSYFLLSNLSVAINGAFTANAGTTTINGTTNLSGSANLYNIVINSGKTLRMGTNSVLGIANTFTKTGTFIVTTNVPNLVSYNGTGNQIVANATYHNLQVCNGGTKTPSAGFTINNDFTISAGTTFNASTFTYVLSRHFINFGIFTPSTSTFQLNGLNVATITGVTTFNNLTINKSSAVISVNLANNITTNNLTFTTGNIQTASNSIMITGTRTGNGIIIGTITHSHAFVTGTAYYFEGPYNGITFTSPSASLNSVTITVTLATVNDFNSGLDCVNREYIISIPSGTYTNATLRLHYEDNELNAYSEPFLSLYKYNSGTNWDSIGYSSKSTILNYVEQTGIALINSRWTFSGVRNVVRWNGSVSSAWENLSNWTTISGASMSNRVPVFSDLAEIGTTGFTFEPTINSSQSVNNIVFGSAQAATIKINSGSLTTIAGIKGKWTSNTIDVLDVASGSLFVGTNLDLSDGIVNRGITFKIGSGSATINYNLNQSVSARSEFTGNGSLIVGGNYNLSGGDFIAGSGTVSYIGSEAQIIAPVTYNNLTISKITESAYINSPVIVNGNFNMNTGGELIINDTLTVIGNFTIGSGTNVIEEDVVINVGGNWINGGSFTVNNGVVNFNGSTNQSVGANTFNSIIVNKLGGTLSLTNDIIINSDLTIESGILNLSTYLADRSNPGGAFIIGSTGVLKVSGASNFPENYNTINLNSASTVEYRGAIVQNLQEITYGNLTLTNGASNAKILTGDIQINGDLLINSGSTFDPNSKNITLYGNFTNSGTYTPSNSTLILNGVSKTFTGNTTLYNLSVIIGSVSVATGSISLAGDLLVDTTGSLNFGSSSISLDGDLTNKGTLISNGIATFTGTRVQTLQLNNSLISSSTGVVNFNGTVAPVSNSTSAPTFATVNINNTGGVSPTTPWTVYFACNIGPGAIFNAGALTHTFYGNFINNGSVVSNGELKFLPQAPFSSGASITLDGAGSFTSTGKVEFGGTETISIVDNNPVFNLVYVTNVSTSGVTPPNSWSIPQELYIGPGATFNGGNSISHIISGNLTNNGILNGQSSTIEFSGNPVAISGTGISTFYNLTILSGADLSLNKSIGILKDFTNNGNFNAIGRTVKFTGTLSSNIGGSAAFITFDDFEQDKSSTTTTLTKPCIITGDLVLTNGIINTTIANLLTLDDNATSTSGSSTSFVDGPLRKIGNDAFVFPIGNNSIWARIGISAPSQITDSYTAQYYASAFSNTTSMAGVPSPALTRVSTVEYWVCDRNSGSSNVNIQLFWESNVRSGIISYGSDLSVAHWNGTAWENYGQNAITGTANGNITSLPASSFNQFTFGSRGVNPLPIELIYFEAKLNESQTVELKWSTASEINNNYFSIERSVDGVNFEMFMNINGAGNSTSIISYIVLDKKPLTGLSYYRLVQVDYNGNQEYSKIVSVYNFNQLSNFIVYPNPANRNGFNISFSGNSNDLTNVKLFDSKGQELYSRTILFTDAEKNVFIDLVNVTSSGVYYVICSNKTGIEKQKIIVN